MHYYHFFIAFLVVFRWIKIFLALLGGGFFRLIAPPPPQPIFGLEDFFPANVEFYMSSLLWAELSEISCV